MGIRYSHLSDAERCAIETKLKEGLSQAAIARALRRHPSSISREIKRGFWRSFGCYLAHFLKRAQAGLSRRKLDPQMLKPAWAPVLFGLRQDWSPQQLCDRLNDGALPAGIAPPGLTLSHETIYRAIYGMPRGQQHAALVKMLRRSTSGRRRPR